MQEIFANGIGIDELKWQDLRLAYCTTNGCDNQLTVNHTQTQTKIDYNQIVNFPDKLYNPSGCPLKPYLLVK